MGEGNSALPTSLSVAAHHLANSGGPGSMSRSVCRPHERFCLFAQNMCFEPVVQVQTQFLFGARRHPVPVLVEPCCCSVQPMTRVFGPPEAVACQGEPEPVDNGLAGRGVGEKAL